MKYNNKSIINKILIFIKVFSASFILLLLGARFVGLTPKQFNPIPWDIIFKSEINQIIWMSFILSAVAVILSFNKKLQ